MRLLNGQGIGLSLAAGMEREMSEKGLSASVRDLGRQNEAVAWVVKKSKYRSR